jgi:hypothetical protein
LSCSWCSKNNRRDHRPEELPHDYARHSVVLWNNRPSAVMAAFRGGQSVVRHGRRQCSEVLPA